MPSACSGLRSRPDHALANCNTGRRRSARSRKFDCSAKGTACTVDDTCRKATTRVPSVTLPGGSDEFSTQEGRDRARLPHRCRCCRHVLRSVCANAEQPGHPRGGHGLQHSPCGRRGRAARPDDHAAGDRAAGHPDGDGRRRASQFEFLDWRDQSAGFRGFDRRRLRVGVVARLGPGADARAAERAPSRQYRIFGDECRHQFDSAVGDRARRGAERRRIRDLRYGCNRRRHQLHPAQGLHRRRGLRLLRRFGPGRR